MKVTVENKKGLTKDLRVFIDKKTMSSYINLKSKNTADIYCEDWSEKTKLKTNFQVRILNKEFKKYLNYEAYK